MVGLMIMRLILAIAFLALLAIPAQAQTRQCTKITPFQHTTPTGPVWIVPGVQNQRVYYCGFMLAQKGNTLDFKIWFAADAGCVETGTLGPTWSLPTDMAIVNRTEQVGPYGPYGFGICIQTFGSGALTGAIYWEQF
jgi:hypothetical protein